ncbi:hypothetical protein OBBRIDRAFT_221664 [Obba rivulosa]|uniref:Uncharacterized protein n=1 Tax=Obba rivulosa TaxID=1052685 RepID=A0A8E2DH05_9APHY|nr:hypothetical protein OBBRIDRAFT_221664 [Obba rivulosa]
MHYMLGRGLLRVSSSSASSSSDSEKASDDETRDDLMLLRQAESEELPRRKQEKVSPPPRRVQSAPAGPVHSQERVLSFLSASQDCRDTRNERLLVGAFPPMTKWDYPVIQFIEKVYGIDVNQLYRASDTPIRIKRGDIDGVSRGVGERGSYGSFIEIMDSLEIRTILPLCT